ncbi:MAG: hypothetical protein NT069_36050 [Planctomycetota bacterium]|nr:hypothetical protein [Planctomycetota bacterium]
MIALVVFGVILSALDPAGDHRSGWDGPGMSVDEPLNVGQGVMLVDKLLDFDFKGFRQVDAALTDYPPLGRVWIGVCHEIAFLLNPPIDEVVPYSLTCARVSSAILFAVTVWWIGAAAARFWGLTAGVVSSVALVLMPRSFGHAHLANLETAINLLYAACLLFVCRRVPEMLGGDTSLQGALEPQRSTVISSRSPAQIAYWTTAIGAGVLMGLAFSIKVQAIFLPAALGAWALLWLRWRAPVWLVVVGLVAAGVFFVGWPWLWDDPLQHAIQYFGKTTNRVSIQAWYFGEALTDRDVPWHYPWVMFGVTVPLGLHLLGLASTVDVLRSLRTTPRESLLAAGILVPLVAFSVPGIAVYDGERLFSIAFPLWALLIGRAAGRIVDWFAVRRWCGRPLALGALTAFVAAQSIGLWRDQPAWLSYYSSAIGGLSGADKLGLPATYWGDGLTRSLIAQVADLVPEESSIAVAPTLYELQPLELERQAIPLKRRNIHLVSLGATGGRDAAYLLLFNRPEYLPPELRRLRPSDFVAVVERDGVWLAGLLRNNTPHGVERVPSESHRD